MVTLIIFLIILSVLVVVHEAGHFLAAKKFDIPVDEFGLGYPPRAKKLFSWKGTDFTLNWLPFGGFVKIFGETPSEDEAVPQGLIAKNRAVQAIVFISGILANFIFAWLLFSIVLFIGIDSGGQIIQHGFLGAIWHGLLTTVKVTGIIASALGALIASIFHGRADFSGIVGPIGLASLVGDARSFGTVYLLYFTALISANLAVVNLLPIPALDGGRLLMLAVEALRRKPISTKFVNIANNASFALLVLLMILVSIRDLVHLF